MEALEERINELEKDMVLLGSREEDEEGNIGAEIAQKYEELLVENEANDVIRKELQTTVKTLKEKVEVLEKVDRRAEGDTRSCTTSQFDENKSGRQQRESIDARLRGLESRLSGVSEMRQQSESIHSRLHGLESSSSGVSEMRAQNLALQTEMADLNV